jgi:hypothetical protein
MVKPSTTFKKGDPLINRGGRPKKGETLTDILRSLGEIKDVGTADGKMARKQALGERLWKMAIEGDIVAIKYIFDRVDGPPKMELEHSGGISIIINDDI